jgi:hypothetical protein
LSELKDEINLEFWEPSQALMALYDLEKYSSEDRKKMNESMLADIHGDDAILPPRSRLSPEALAFMQ